MKQRRGSKPEALLVLFFGMSWQLADEQAEFGNLRMVLNVQSPIGFSEGPARAVLYICTSALIKSVLSNRLRCHNLKIDWLEIRLVLAKLV